MTIGTDVDDETSLEGVLLRSQPLCQNIASVHDVQKEMKARFHDLANDENHLPTLQVLANLYENHMPGAPEY